MTAKTRLEAIFGTANENRLADIIFVHGLGGDPLTTWHPQGKKEKSNSWMSWLGEDLKEVGVWSIGYEVEPFTWRGGTMPLADRAINIVELLDEYDLGEKPLIFVTHSMGGLVVKQMLRHAQDFGNPAWEKIVAQTKGIVFLSTPHSGSDIANWLKYIGGVLGKSVSVTELEANDSRLLELNEVYRNHTVLSQIPIKVYCETEATYGAIVVDKTSANPGIPGATPIPLEKNHLNIAKPQSREDRPYRGVRKFIKDKLCQPLPFLQTRKSTPKAEREIIKVENGNYIENLEGDYIHVEGNYIQNPEPKKKLNTPSNLNYRGSANFVGRDKQLEELHELLQKNEQVTISAIAGMGGIGKTELALQYANNYKEDYPGSLCWFSVRGESLVTQIIEYAASYLNRIPPKELETDLAKVNYCWRNWNVEPSLIVLDDVPDYGKYYREQIAPYLPPITSQIKVLMTSREKPGVNIPRLDLNVLSEDSALEFLKSLIGETRVETELDTAKELCEWLGYLPLGLELVGRYIDLDSNLTIEKTLQRLKRKEIKARALLPSEQADMNAQLGVAAAFDLSWDVLTPEAQELGCYLSLFDSEPFKWSWVESAWIESENEEEREDLIEDLELLKSRQLIRRNLLNEVRANEDSTEYNYQLHSLIAQYFRAKLALQENATDLKQKFCRVTNQIAQSIGESPTLAEIQAFSIAIPHLSVVANRLTEHVDDEELLWSYEGLGTYYKGQGLYEQAIQWLEKCLTMCQERLGEEHPDVATSLNSLALLYSAQGRYSEAEPLYLKSLQLRQKLMGEEHPDVATILDNLGALYESQGKYEDAEHLILQAFQIRQKLLGEVHPEVALSLNNLAALYDSQGKYEDAEPLYLKSLELYKQLLGEEHPDVATSLNNLAELYRVQGKYEDAEPLLLKTLELRKQLLGEEHPKVALSLNNLAYLYHVQGKYEDAELLQINALELRKQLLGEEHPDVAQSLNNLALLYYDQGRYEDAELLQINALELRQKLLGEVHPDVAQSLNNLALIYESQGKYEDAELLLQRALKLNKQLLGEEHPYVATSLKNLAKLCRVQGKYEDAEHLSLKALEIARKALGEEHPSVALSLNNLALIYESQEKYEDAELLQIKALEIARKALGEDHPHTKKIRGNLADLQNQKE